jgi:hypothetical protein
MVTSRILFTATQKAELWDRWKNGQSAAAISGAMADNIHRIAPMGARVLIIGIWYKCWLAK